MRRSFSMAKVRINRVRFSALASSLVLAACSAGNPTDSVEQSQESLLGDALPGIAAAAFAEAKANFQAVEGLSDGLGPIFNERACGSCHTNGQTGGAGEQIERRYGTFDNVFAGRLRPARAVRRLV